METTAHTTKRKIIDIKPETFRRLSIIAASQGTNLKHFIETSLDEIAEAKSDTAMYKYLCQTHPEGMEMASEEESDAFLKELGL